MRDAPRETGARVPAPRVDGWRRPAEKVRANVGCRWSPGEHPPAENARRSVTRDGAPGYGRRGGFTTRVGSDFAAWRGRSVVNGRHSTPFRRASRGGENVAPRCEIGAPRPESRRTGSADGAHSRPRLPQKNRAELWTHLCTTRIDRTNRQCATVSPAPASFRGAGASQLFPHRLKRNAALRRRDPVPFPAPPRPLTRAFARASPFAA